MMPEIKKVIAFPEKIKDQPETYVEVPIDKSKLLHAKMTIFVYIYEKDNTSWKPPTYEKRYDDVHHFAG